jgi:hypothetical protein
MYVALFHSLTWPSLPILTGFPSFQGLYRCWVLLNGSSFLKLLTRTLQRYCYWAVLNTAENLVQNHSCLLVNVKPTKRTTSRKFSLTVLLTKYFEVYSFYFNVWVDTSFKVLTYWVPHDIYSWTKYPMHLFFN